MPKKVNYMKHGDHKVKEFCKQCHYLDSSLGVEHAARCRSGSCPDLTMTEDEKKYFLDNWVNNHFEYEKTWEELLHATWENAAKQLTEELDREILDKMKKVAEQIIDNPERRN